MEYNDPNPSVRDWVWIFNYLKYIVTGFTIYLPKAKNTLYALYFTHFNPLNWPPIANIDDGGGVGDGGRGG